MSVGEPPTGMASFVCRTNPPQGLGTSRRTKPEMKRYLVFLIGYALFRAITAILPSRSDESHRILAHLPFSSRRCNASHRITRQRCPRSIIFTLSMTVRAAAASIRFGMSNAFHPLQPDANSFIALPSLLPQAHYKKSESSTHEPRFFSCLWPHAPRSAPS